VSRLLAALADKQVPVSQQNVDYWFADILAAHMEEALGHSEAPWAPLTNSAIVIVPSRNCEKFIGECLDSLTAQSWSDLGVIVIDDCSDDRTAVVAREHLKGIDHLVIKNSRRRWALYNIDTAIFSYCDNENSVIFLLDGDDYLIDDTAIEEMMRHHGLGKDVVWSSYKTNVKGWAHTGGMMDPRVPIRKQFWNMSPLRSFKKFLFDAIDRNEFLDESGEYLKVTWDQAIMFPIAEMTPPERWHFVPEIFYFYRMHEGNDHWNDGRAKQQKAEKLIRSRPSAALLQRYRPKEATVSVVVSCYNQREVLPIFLESMFFQDRCPTEVVVADDGSSDGVCEWIDEVSGKYPFPLRYVTRRHEGYRLAAVENLAAKFATGERILFTNADVIHSPDSIRSHSLAEGVGGGVVKGIMTSVAKSVTVKMVRDFKSLKAVQEGAASWRNNLGYMAKTDPQVNPIGVWGGNFSVPRDKFEEVGGFDEGFKGWGGEDNDLVRRLVRAGCKAGWVKESEVIHLDHDKKKYASEQSGSSRYVARLMRGS
jgi:glycosyltransferase involved in cell wall biosynthesis